eukprot:1159854-Pelagomonas_calceolata.AAC.7
MENIGLAIDGFRNAKTVNCFLRTRSAMLACLPLQPVVVDALNSIGVPFGSFDILSDQAVREGMKVYSNWPTFPQLYVKGELMGGCDIVLQMQVRVFSGISFWLQGKNENVMITCWWVGVGVSVGGLVCTASIIAGASLKICIKGSLGMRN